MENILVIALHKLGDNLQVTPIFRVLRQKYPRARIAVLTEKPYALPFLRNPCIDELCYFDRTPYSGGGLKSLSQARSEMREDLAGLISRRFTLIVNRHSSIEGAVIAGVLGAREIRGLYMREDGVAAYDDPWTRLLFAACQRRPENPFNFVDYGINIAGAWAQERKLEVYAEEGQAEEIFKRHHLFHEHRIIAVQPGSNSPMRRWSTASFAKAVEGLLALGERYRVAILGAPSEAGLAREISERMAPDLHSRVVDLSSEVPLPALPGLLKRCSLLITNDTGPMHVAAAVGCPVIALYFGESFVNETGPYGSGNFVIHAKLPCLPCTYVTQCQRAHACRDMVKPEQVIELTRFALEAERPLNKAIFTGTEVHFSGKGPRLSEINFRPLLRPTAAPDDIMRIIYRAVFLRYLSEIKWDPVSLVRQVQEDYSGAKECVDTMVDLNVSLINLFARTQPEQATLCGLVRECFLQIRAGLA
jgi:ADP-heptose:LPS heptosyltransferase